MFLNAQNIVVKARFAACESGARLLQICARAAGRRPVSKSVSPSHLSAGRNFHGGVSSGLQKINLTRCEIFRGKVPRAKSKTKNFPENKTRPRPKNYE
jgi:hypothetical protein